jgi:3-methyl-2-oxobutanoate hydroxymethyltransferase
MATAHDHESGRLADLAGIDAVVVGDSIAITVLGGETIVSATLDEMILFARATVRGARRALVVGDLPFGSYQVSDEHAVRDAIRLVKEGGVNAVKLEGGGSSISRAHAIAEAGIAVMGHLVPAGGMTWVSDEWRLTASQLAQRAYADALALEEAGCFAVMLECVPAAVAARITKALEVPTIGFGCGPACDGQIVGLQDLLGLTDSDPSRYVKRYADLAKEAKSALEHFAAEVRQGVFPSEANAEPMPGNEQLLFEASLSQHER